jgi:predicted dienelactone hydrolase
VFRSILALAVVFCLAATLAEAAGVRFFDIPSDSASPALAGAVWYPCAAPPHEMKIENRVISGVRDCEMVGSKLPLIVISHGRTAWFGAHHDTAAAKRLLDFMLSIWPDAPKIDRKRIGLFGFSMGGYTGLVVIGSIPDFRRDLPGCEGSRLRACEQLRNNQRPTWPSVHDLRVRTAVIVDPGPGIFFPTENLKAVTIPVQLWSSDPKLGAQYDSGCCGLGIRNRLPSKPDFHLATGAIHVSFLAPCSPEEKEKPEFSRICTDARTLIVLLSTRISTPTY